MWIIKKRAKIWIKKKETFENVSSKAFSLISLNSLEKKCFLGLKNKKKEFSILIALFIKIQSIFYAIPN